jgi:RNA polymerase sigma factor FliA
MSAAVAIARVGLSVRGRSANAKSKARADPIAASCYKHNFNLAVTPEVEKTTQFDELSDDDATRPTEMPGSVQAIEFAEVKESDQARRDRLVLKHLPLARAIAVRVHENLPPHVDLDDLAHAGILGLIDAASKYKAHKKIPFSSYAKFRIKGAILDSLRQLDCATRDIRRRYKQMEAAARDLATELGRNPTEAEVADKLGVDVDRWREMMIDLRNTGLISASTRAGDQDELPAPEFPSKPESQPDNMCVREQLRSVLGLAVETLPERYQTVVNLYYKKEMTMREIGGVLGIHESRVSQIHTDALGKMQDVLQSNGIRSSTAF